MASFTDIQANIRESRAALAKAQAALDLARRRHRLGGDGAAAIAEADKEVSAARARLASIIAGFVPYADPRKALSNWSSGFPLALLPVRVETRFHSDDGDPPLQELWVRIYPDDCWIDTFEPNLSASELDNAKRYWRSIWRAGGVEADRRAAWRALVSAHGSGRASYIVDTWQPLNVAKLPKKDKATDIILVIPTQVAPGDDDARAVSAYWQAVWLADGEAAATQSAFDALAAAPIGAARAAQLVRDYVPFNLQDAPASGFTRSTAVLSVDFVVFAPDPAALPESWTQAPRLSRFPDCFVVLGYQGGQQTVSTIGSPVVLPLYVGPDPQAPASQSIHPDPVTGDLFVPDELKWLVDFPAAVAAGMGLKVPLTPEQVRSGFDRLLVLGVQMSSTEQDGAAGLAELLQHHAAGRGGLAILGQGTPTHNTSGASSGHGRIDDPDISFDDREKAPLFAPTPDPLARRDGQCVAEVLGLAPAVLQGVHGAGGLDQASAHAMQRALWPATIGYWMDKLLAPAFSDDTIEQARWFAANHVSGRGAVPPIRIGGQPYGILPTTAYSRITWLGDRGRQAAGLTDGQWSFMARLLDLLRKIDADWIRMSGAASYLGKAGDAHQILLDIIGQHPDSAEFHSRFAESVDELFNTANLGGIGPSFMQFIDALSLRIGGAQLLQKLGYSGRALPDILNHLFDSNASPVTAVVDDRPVSETDGLRASTVDGHNYLHWLLHAARASLDALRQEQGFAGNASPRALLYLYLRQALMLGYFDTSYRLHKGAGFLAAPELAAMKPEPIFIHVDTAAPQSESRFAALYKTEPRITGSNAQLVSDYITANYAALPEAADFADQLAALQRLADLPTAALERLFAEHVDICTYRFDAWLLGLVHAQLAVMRRPDGKSDARQGVYLGAYAWLENLRPAAGTLAPVQLPSDLAASFPGDAPLMQDPANGGYVHAPSLPHARTAAVLRSGYLANASAANPKTMSVNLSSDRVRLALSILEGIRNGQSLGALLGYRFERGLHDDHDLTEVDKFIYPLRKAFPLVAGAIDGTPMPPEVSIDAVEARNVLDGRKLVARIQSSGDAKYPFGLAGLPAASASESAAIDAEADRLLDAYDAIADLALAEGVHQAVQGNFDRIGATLDAYSSGHFPPDPEVVRTPSSGVGLTHRVVVHFRPGLAAPAGATPRATAEPALDDWLRDMIPPLTGVSCTVMWSVAATGSSDSCVVKLSDLDLAPIDIVALLRPDSAPAMTELDDRVLGCAIAARKPRPDAQFQILYATASAGQISVFAFSALVRSLRAVLTRSRALRASDTLLRADSDSGTDAASIVSRDRIAVPLAALKTLLIDVATLVGDLRATLPDPLPQPIPAAVLGAIVNGIDGFLDRAAGLLERAARFGMPQAGWGFTAAWKREAYAGVSAALKDLVKRWNAKLADFGAKMAVYRALPGGTSDADRFAALRAAELSVSTQLAPLPAHPSDLEITIQNKADDFKALRDKFDAIVGTVDPSLANLLGAVKALLPISSYDTRPFDVSEFENRAPIMTQDLLRILGGLMKAMDDRRAATQAQLDTRDAAAVPADRTAAMQSAARALLGEDFTIYPEFTPAAAQSAEWGSAYAASGSGDLTKWLTTTGSVDFPVDEWLAGVARVRPALHAWEAVANVATGFGLAEPALTPVQFPFEQDAPWLALQFPADYDLSSERLLYTAQYPPGAFDPAAPQCGLLIDEWAEQVPIKPKDAESTYRDTGLAFHYNRPNSEAPQSILLVTPASAAAQWQWDDLVGALNDTLDLAKKRALEPAQIDPTAYAGFVPATVMAATLYGISISTNLAVANGLMDQMRKS